MRAVESTCWECEADVTLYYNGGHGIYFTRNQYYKLESYRGTSFVRKRTCSPRDADEISECSWCEQDSSGRWVASYDSRLHS